ncbi:hypothetical protein DRQ16_03260 [bacterium]|nr:MAG: hypothetical protein DRQ16_03260 [bacterium]RKZ23338.1 MAG: hypothetical protein DRQ18_00760 [bacterium]
MIVTLRKLSYEDLKKKLKKEDKIVIWSCNNCVKFCNGLGGREAMARLKEKLEKDGFNVIHTELIGLSCVLDLVHLRALEEPTKTIFEEATVIIPLACEDGYENLKHVFKDKRIIDVPLTVGLGVFSTEFGALRLTVPFEDTGIEAKVEGIPLEEVAKKLGVYAGPF